MENSEIIDSVRRGNGVPGGASPMAVLPSCLRGSFRAPAGTQFVCSDYSLIEVRVLAWLTECSTLLQAFADDLDAYKAFATKMFNVPYDQVTKAQRQIAKPAVLACGYGSSGGSWKLDAAGDQYKSGLWGQAESYGVEMTQQEAAEAVDIYRSTYHEVPAFWYSIEDPIRGLLRNPVHGIAKFGRLLFQLYPDKMLRIILPSGRSLHYLKPALEDNNITFDTELIGKHRGRRRLYGSLLTENLVQAIARDVMAVGMVRAAGAGFHIVGHTHDELLCLETLDKHHDLTYLNNMMCNHIEWADGLPLKVDGWEGEVYRK